MTTSFRLTEGSIAKITLQGATAPELEPILQVTDLKQVKTPQQNLTERYRLLVSDGIHLQQSMLATQINPLIKDGRLRHGSLVQLLQYTCSAIQTKLIIVILDLKLVATDCPIIGRPIALQSSPAIEQAPADQSGNAAANSRSTSSTSVSGGVTPNVSNAHPSLVKVENGAGHAGANSSNAHAYHNASFQSAKSEVLQPQPGTFSHPSRQPYHQPPPTYNNRGPIARNEAPARIIPIAALNPYQGKFTIKARVTAKGELRHYNNPRGEGKVFSFDLLDSEGGEIRVTCFNAVADQFHPQIEVGRVYLISRGNLKPAQKNFNHLRNDYELHLDTMSTIQPCFEDDSSIPRQQFHFRPISDVEGLENNSIVDVIGIVSCITPTTSIMRKNGTETQKRTLQLKDMSGRSVELTLWGNFCQEEGQKLQNMCDSGHFPVLAVKGGRVNDFNGKSVGTISTSQLFIEPDFQEARQLQEWFDKEGRNIPSISLSREMSNVARTDAIKTISQIKDENLGTSEKPDWISVSATVIYLRSDSLCYTACPIMNGDRQCTKKVINNGDGKWQCERCDQSVDECDYRYIIQLQIQDHTGITWVTAFQESGEEIMGIPAKDLYYLKHEKQDDEGFSRILRQVLFTKYVFKLRVKEETFGDEQRVKSTIVKAEKVNYSSQSSLLLDLLQKFTSGNASTYPSSGVSQVTNDGSGQAGWTGFNNMNNSYAGGEFRSISSNQFGQTGTHNSSRFPQSDASGFINPPAQATTGTYNNRTSYGSAGSGASGECYKCHQVGHWARDCPGLGSVPPTYGGSSISSGRYTGAQRQVGGF